MAEYRRSQCKQCLGDTKYHCESFQCDLCNQCKENHVHDLKTVDHNVKISVRDLIIPPSPKKEICVKHPNIVYDKSVHNVIFRSVFIAERIKLSPTNLNDIRVINAEIDSVR